MQVLALEQAMIGKLHYVSIRLVMVNPPHSVLRLHPRLVSVVGRAVMALSMARSFGVIDMFGALVATNEWPAWQEFKQH